MLQPGPLRAFYERTKARRGHGKAIVATARKLAILFWCMLIRGEDYAYQQPSLTRKKLRRLGITAGAKKNTRRAAGVWATNAGSQETFYAPARPVPTHPTPEKFYRHPLTSIGHRSIKGEVLAAVVRPGKAAPFS